MEFNFKLLFKQFILILILVYILFGAILFFFQDDFIYITNNQDFYNCNSLDYTQKINYNGTRFYYKNNSENLIVFYHGNAGSACDRSMIANLFNEHNYSFIIVEYSGYSNQKISPSKELLFKDVENINSYIQSLNYDKLVIGSESIGSAFASYHVSLSYPDKVFLISPFDKLSNVVYDKYPFYPIELMLRDKFNNYEMYSNFNGSIIIFHGDKDNLIPNKLSHDLYNSLNIENKKYLLKEGKGHNDMYSYELFEELMNFIEN